MRGYVARKGERWYAVVYEGLDPVTGRERRTWHPAGSDREEAERLATRLAAELNGRNDKVRSLTFGAYLSTQWLPRKKTRASRSDWRTSETQPAGLSVEDLDVVARQWLIPLLFELGAAGFEDDVDGLELPNWASAL